MCGPAKVVVFCCALCTRTWLPTIHYVYLSGIGTTMSSRAATVLWAASRLSDNDYRVDQLRILSCQACRMACLPLGYDRHTCSHALMLMIVSLIQYSPSQWTAAGPSDCHPGADGIRVPVRGQYRAIAENFVQHQETAAPEMETEVRDRWMSSNDLRLLLNHIVIGWK
jgi:hypothetical protein